ncbi:hypothetical protein DLAC_06556 [Tieghemostelium lacteum]|uniref:WH2 domain-containing protein n=1 Tax=Tieghemostelium lacteum TaxID=361077 RepID=A0A151ZF27_TIELA|nr:hypothetical protein DLAC_06556 [Tieghemostelium lacteum]|eukprot:KYQ92568.1 hypothetical protein DLAC_06556 [Tieghemostelium lacteum]
MVLITRYIPSINDNNKPVLDNLNKDQIVDAVLHNTCVGIINQLMVLAEHANNVFTSLSNESTLICQRLNKINSRIKPLIQQIPVIENYHQNNSIEVLNSKPRAEYHADNPEKHQHFTHASIPPSVNNVYQSKCKPPPNLALLDPYMDDGQKCLKLYTNPDFFIDEWIAEQIKQSEEAKQRRRERREARLKKKSEKTADVEVKKVKRVRKVRYDPVTGEKIVIEVDGPIGGGPQQSPTQTPHAISQQPLTTSHQPTFHTPPPPSNFSMPPPPPINATLPRPPSVGPNTFAMPPPPPPTSDSFSMPPPPMIQQTPPPFAVSSIPQPVMQTAYVPPPPPGPPPPPPPNAPPPPVFKAEAPKPKASDARSDLLTSIMSGISLKPAEERKIPEIQQQNNKSEPINIADILARRIAWAASDSDDDSEDDSDWD